VRPSHSYRVIMIALYCYDDITYCNYDMPML
jgi:hypothetical protein